MHPFSCRQAARFALASFLVTACKTIADAPSADVKDVSHQLHDDVAVHGMIVFGEKSIYMYHLPLCSGIHAWQVILDVTMTDASGKNVHAAYLANRTKTGAPLYSFQPNPFSLQGVKSGAVKSFTGTLVRGHFERDGEPLITGVSVQVNRVIKSDPIGQASPDVDPMQTFIFGRPDEVYAANIARKCPNYDHIAKVSLTPAQTAEVLLSGLAYQVDGRKSRYDERLKSGDQAELSANGASASMTVGADVWLNTSDLGE